MTTSSPTPSSSSKDEREVFLFNADVLEFEESMAEEVKTMLAERYGIDRDCVLLSATHDHTSIVAYHRSWWTGKFDENYYRWFLDTICQCFEECRANARARDLSHGQTGHHRFLRQPHHPR